MAENRTAPRRDTAPRREETTFTRRMRYEFAGDEGRALVTSYAIALSLGLVWLLLVHFGPEVERKFQLLPEQEDVAIEVQSPDVDIAMEEPMPEPAAGPAAAAPAPTRAPTPRPTGGGTPRPGPSTQQLAGAFGAASPTGGGMVGDVGNALRGVDVTTAGGGVPGTTGGRAVIAAGEGGAGSRTPGRGGLGGGLPAGGGSIGNVGGGGGVGRANVSVAPPRVVSAAAVGRGGRDVSELGAFVRGRQQVLRFCYEEHGLKANPNLAGTVGVNISIAPGGQVSNVSIASRSWSGPGASETESCIRQRVAQWRFPSTEAGEGSYAFSFVFSQ